MMTRSPVRRSVMEREAYTLPPFTGTVKLNQNESPRDLPQEVKQQILDAAAARPWNRYPDMTSQTLRETLAHHLSLIPDMILVGNGSNEVLLAALLTLIGPGRRIVVPVPSFSLYTHYAQILESDLTPVMLNSDFSFPVEQLVKEAGDPDTALTLICSPNNPTGTPLRIADLESILQSARGLVLVDEAYREFCGQDFSPLLFRYPNLILTRTFSKAFAFAMGRFGYALAASNTAREIAKVLLPYNIDGFTQAAVPVLLENDSLLRRRISDIVRERDRLFRQLQELDSVTAYPSCANFILASYAEGGSWLTRQLAGRGIWIRDVSRYPGLNNHIRITAGTPEENGRLITELKSILTQGRT